jgi:CoA:oxalate CoA-transferase
VTGQIPGPLGARHPTITPFEAFATSDGSMIIAAGNDGLYLKLCAVLGRKDLAEHADYKTNDLRNRNQAKLKTEIEKELTRKTTAEWIGLIGQGGVPCGPINNIEQALAHPQVAARNMLVTVEDPKAGPLQLSGNPLKLSAFADPPTRPPAPALDQDRASILRELGIG